VCVRVLDRSGEAHSVHTAHTAHTVHTVHSVHTEDPPDVQCPMKPHVEEVVE